MTQLDNENVRNQQLFLGAGLAIGGNLLISISLNLQKFTHVRNSQRAETRHYTRDPLWWLGLVLMILGEVGNFTAYGFAPASLVAPLGTTTVVANMFLAACFLREKIRPENLFGCALAIIGAFLLVTFSSKNERVLDGDEITAALTQIAFLVYIGVEVVALGVLFFLLYKLQMKKVVIFLLITSIIASFTVITAKGVSSMIQLTFAGYPQFRYAVLYVMVIIMVATAIIQVKYLNLAMKEFESSVVVPTNFVFFTISAIVAGIIFYRELWGMTALEICMFIFGCVLSFIGVYFITVSRPPPPEVKPNPPPSQLASDVFPSWLLANVHVGTVQPQGEVSHLSDTDRDKVPMLAAEQLPASVSDDSLDRVGRGSEALPNYGATIQESPTHGEAKREEKG